MSLPVNASSARCPAPMMAGSRCRLPEVGHDGHLGLADREDGVGRGQADVAGGDEVDAAADAVAVHGGDDRLGAACHGGDGVLQAEHLGAAAAGPGRHGAPDDPRRRRRRRPRRQHAAHRLEVEADGEVRPLGRHDDDPHAGVVRRAPPWPGAGPATGPCPMALRASGRSSHRVATASSCSMRSTGTRNRPSGRLPLYPCPGPRVG